MSEHKQQRRVSGFIAPHGFRRGPNPQQRITSKGTRYADVLIEDAQGNFVTVKAWEDDAEREELRPGNFVIAQGPYQENRGDKYTFRELSARFISVKEGFSRVPAHDDAPEEVVFLIGLEEEAAEL
jgi:hypothetical protein